MKMTVKMNNENMIIFLFGDIDHHESSVLRKNIDEIILKERPEKLIFDFSNINFMDSSGIGFVLGRYRLMNELGGRVSVVGTSENIYRIFKMSGAEKYVDIEYR